MNITLIAPPAAGKGTQAEKISQKYGIPHISTGDLLRNVKDEKVKEKLSKGAFVNDTLVADLLEQRLKQNDCNTGYILDGFPRKLDQAKIYENLLAKLHKSLGIIIVLDIEKEIAAKRIIGRKTCPKCGMVFNDLFDDSKSKNKDICDNCGHKLIQRSDDNIETFENRYQTYIKETKPLIKYYEDKNIVYHVNSGINKEYTFKQIEKIIGGLND